MDSKYGELRGRKDNLYELLISSSIYLSALSDRRGQHGTGGIRSIVEKRNFFATAGFRGCATWKREALPMSKILKIILASTLLAVSSPAAFAMDRNDRGFHDGVTPNGTPAGIGDRGRSSEQQEQWERQGLDYGATGSIVPCDVVDQYGNCIDPGYDYDMR